MEKSSAEYSQEISDKELELSKAIKNKEFTDEEEIRLAKEILLLRIKKKDVEVSQSKAHHICRQIELELNDLKRKFWASRNAGL